MFQTRGSPYGTAFLYSLLAVATTLGTRFSLFPPIFWYLALVVPILLAGCVFVHRYFLLLAVIAVGVTVLLLPQEILLQELLNLGMSLGTTILVSEVIFRTARELRQQQKFIHSVLNVVPSHIFVKDRSGRYTLVNEAFAKFLDMTPDEILNKQTEQVSVDPNFRF